MTEQDQRIAIAVACGWTRSEQHDYDAWADYPPGMDSMQRFWTKEGSLKEQRKLPDYTNDLNAMQVAEYCRIYPHDIEKYAQELYMVLERYWTVDRWVKFSRLEIDYAFISAKSHHKAEAFLRTIGNWKDADVLFNIQHEETGRLQEWPAGKPIPYGWAKVSETFTAECGDCDPCLGGRPDQCALKP